MELTLRQRRRNLQSLRCWSGVAGGVGGRLCMAAIVGRNWVLEARIRCWIRRRMRLRSGRFLFIRRGRGGGFGGMILEACEQAAWAAGFRRLEMGATLTGVPFYWAKGYVELEAVEAPLG